MTEHTTLVDTEKMTLTEIAALDHGVLSKAISRVIAEAALREDPLSRFQAAL
ncbi:hypothetical protein GCM10009555_022830 [Acrocarpospora macrocephala]|uniref:FXSXX-COOH protein n=1 Tax=Acrocarpospora macrocephala TaxID=150177 RepID=A0A5M3WS88_9ACTN|nr:hypothetical protein [Acrocarpospora macrocephala]GES12215.1 hypothetical protein Amac_058120 [Acrocarpospora macrocephala]